MPLESLPWAVRGVHVLRRDGAVKTVLCKDRMLEPGTAMATTKPRVEGARTGAATKGEGRDSNPKLGNYAQISLSLVEILLFTLCSGRADVRAMSRQ